MPCDGAGRAAAGALALAWPQPVAFDPSWGFNVVFAAHLTGMLSGALFAWASGLLVPNPAATRDDARR